MKLHLMILALVGGLFMSCERHEFEGPQGTKQLNEPHGGHAGHGGHDAATTQDEPDAAATHGEEKTTH